MMRLSPNGLDLIKRFEGLRLDAYQDVAGIWTIGYGHIKTAKAGMKITEKEAEDLLKDDLSEAEASVSRLTQAARLTQNQFDALVSFEFNEGALAGSTLLKKILLHNFEAAALEFPRWNKAKNPATGELEPVGGLTHRRAAEQALFRSPT